MAKTTHNHNSYYSVELEKAFQILFVLTTPTTRKELTEKFKVNHRTSHKYIITLKKLFHLKSIKRSRTKLWYINLFEESGSNVSYKGYFSNAFRLAYRLIHILINPTTKYELAEELNVHPLTADKYINTVARLFPLKLEDAKIKPRRWFIDFVEGDSRTR